MDLRPEGDRDSAAVQLLGLAGHRRTELPPRRRADRARARHRLQRLPRRSPDLLLFGPAFYFALQPRWALYYAIYFAGALIATGIWALFDNSPAWVFTFPNNDADAIFHTRHRRPLRDRRRESRSPWTERRRNSEPRETRRRTAPIYDGQPHGPDRRLEGAAGAGGAQGQEEDHAAADGHDPHLAADYGEGEGLLGAAGRASKSMSPSSRWAAPARAPSARKETTRGRMP